MAGHSKWHNRMHRKSRQDEKKGKIFSKMAREITVAARTGGPNPEANLRLRIAIEKARAFRVPAENIERAIARATGAGEGADFEELIYEGYGPGGTALLIEVMTDNRNRTAGELRHIFSRNGGNLGEAGCVAWMFERKGELRVDRQDGPGEEELLLAAAEAGAEDVRTDDEEAYRVIAAPDELESVREGLERQGIRVASAELTFQPKTEVAVQGKEAEQLLRLLDLLEEHDDVQQVHTNVTISDEEIDRIEASV